MAAGMPMGTQPVGLGLGECTGWGSHLYFSKLFVPLQKLPGSGYLQHTVTSKDMTKSQRVKHPWFGPCPQGPAQEAQLLVGFTGRRAMRLPMVLGPCHSHGQEGVKTVRQLTPNLETACAPQGTPKSFWSHPPALPVTAEQGEPLLLEIPRMSWANHWANIFPLGDLPSWTRVILMSQGPKTKSKVLCEHMLAHSGEGGMRNHRLHPLPWSLCQGSVNSSGVATGAGWALGWECCWKTHNIKQRVDLQWGRWDQGHQQRGRHTETSGCQSKA